MIFLMCAKLTSNLLDTMIKTRFTNIRSLQFITISKVNNFRWVSDTYLLESMKLETGEFATIEIQNLRYSDLEVVSEESSYYEMAITSTLFREGFSEHPITGVDVILHHPKFLYYNQV